MRTAMADFDRLATAGQIQIVSHDEWYTKHGVLDSAETVQSWMSRKDEAIASGYAGLRISGNTSFLDESTWDAFLDFEGAADVAFRGQPIVALCSYCLAKCPGKAVLDVMHRHGFGLAKRHGHWQPIEIKSRGHLSSRAEAHRHSLSERHDLLTTSPSQEADLVQIVEEQLAAYILAYPERIRLEGGHVELPASPAAKLRIAIQELVANATKFGALSTPQGRLALTWRVAVNGSRRLHMTWTESGMSRLTIPDKIGFGTQLIAGAVENCVRVFEPTAMVCTFELNL